MKQTLKLNFHLLCYSNLGLVWQSVALRTCLPEQLCTTRQYWHINLTQKTICGLEKYKKHTNSNSMQPTLYRAIENVILYNFYLLSDQVANHRIGLYCIYLCVCYNSSGFSLSDLLINVYCLGYTAFQHSDRQTDLAIVSACDPEQDYMHFMGM